VECLERAAARTCGRKKKLREVAAHWAKKPERRDLAKTYAEERKALAEWGASEADITAALAAREPDPEPAVEIWPEHLEVFGIFCALETQWRTAAGLVVMKTGLDYLAAIALMREHAIPRKRRVELLEELHDMELGAIGAWYAAADEEEPEVTSLNA